MKRTLAVTLALVLLPATAWSAKSKVWNHHAPSHYEKAELKQLVMTTEGSLRLARELRPLVGVEAEHVWAIVEDAAGNLCVATGNEGKLFRVTPDGKASVVYQSEDSQILSLVAGPEGVVYAGTGPTGQVLRVSPDGKVDVLAKTGESYVWALAFDPQAGDLIAGTGPHGRVLKITPDGKSTTFYTTKQDHVLCLAPGLAGEFYAGTSKQGLVYRIERNGKGFVLFDAPQTEVRSLLVTREGVYAGTSSPSTRRAPGTTTSRAESTPVALSDIVPTSTTPAKADSRDGKEAAGPSPAPASSASPSSGGASAPSVPPPSSKENCVYRISADGAVRELFREKAMVQGLLQHEGRLLIATGGDGQVFEVTETSRERCELVRLDHTQVHCLCRRQDGGIVLGTGDAGKLYVLGGKHVANGTLTSEVLDAKSLSRWGALRWKGDMPAGTKITVACRSGNVVEPDDTWSDWSAEQTDAAGAVVSAPAARFVQYRVTLASENPSATPALTGIALRYQTANLAPEVATVEVPDLDAVTLESAKRLKLRWTATDGNEDELTYSLFYRKEGWQQWVELEADLEKREYEWDTTTTPAGVYRIKVVASDRRDNAEEDALAGERISSPFVIDHVAPQITVQVVGYEGDRALVEARAADGLTRLVSGSFSVDSKKWTNIFPADGLFDTKEETFRFKTDALKPGTHVLVLRATDAAGNVGSSDVVFTVKERQTAER